MYLWDYHYDSLFFVIGINSDQDSHQQAPSSKWLVCYEELPEEGQDRSDLLPWNPVNWLKKLQVFLSDPSMMMMMMMVMMMMMMVMMVMMMMMMMMIWIPQ